VLYDNKGAIVAVSSGLPPTLTEDHVIVSNVMDSDVASGNFVEVDDEMRYVLVEPLHHEDSIVGALVVIQNAGYISTSIREIWERNLLRLGIQVLLFSFAIFIIFRMVIFRQIATFAESVRRLRSGDEMPGFASDKSVFFKPLAAEIAQITQSLFQARMVASEEARMRLEKIDTPWTAARLREFVKVYLKDRPIFVVTNREPYEHQKTKGGIECRVPAGGVVTALEPVMEACGGTWIAHGSGSADKLTVDEHDKMRVPPMDPQYTLKRVWLDDKEVDGYYKGFSNEALWPLCLLVHTRPLFRKQDWEIYQKVNEKFAQSVLEEIKSVPNPLVLVQDYHLALLPALIKKKRPDAQVGIFWHIPWPSPESFSVCPWRKEILRGMLSADIVGFHTQQFCNNFLNTVSKEIESLTDLEQFSITHQGHTSYIKPFPISIAFDEDAGPSDGEAADPAAVARALGPR
jgi:trehalose 6-phosphate synthase